MVALYSLCVILPIAALAFGDTTRAANCLFEGHLYTQVHAQKPSHNHADAAAGHKHHDHGLAVQEEKSAPAKHSETDHEKSANCCGLFCFNAVATIAGYTVDQPIGAIPVTLASDANLTGRGPERLIRPPITLLSL